jgi:hypothetical protein
VVEGVVDARLEAELVGWVEAYGWVLKLNFSNFLNESEPE